MYNNRLGVISNYDATRYVSENIVSFYLWKTATTYQHCCSLILIYIVLSYMRRTIKHYDTIVVIVYSIIFDPAVSAFNDKYSFCPARMYVIIKDDCVTRTLSTQSDICLKVGMYIILFYMSTCPFDQ